jgi:hypothetical protein
MWDLIKDLVRYMSARKKVLAGTYSHHIVAARQPDCVNSGLRGCAVYLYPF